MRNDYRILVLDSTKRFSGKIDVDSGVSSDENNVQHLNNDEGMKCHSEKRYIEF